MKVELVPISRIQPNAYNPNVMQPVVFSELVDNIKRRGFKSAIYVLPADGAGIHRIVDGEHRWKAAKLAGEAQIPCIVLPATLNEAMADTITMNHLRGQMLPVRLALVVADLAKQVPIDKLEKQLGFEPGELKDNLELLKLPDDIGPKMKAQAKAQEQETFTVVSFVVPKPKADMIESVVGKIQTKLDGRNKRGQAFEVLASEYAVKQQATP